MSNVLHLDAYRLQRDVAAMIKALRGARPVLTNPWQQRMQDHLDTTINRAILPAAHVAAAEARLRELGPSGRELSIDQMRHKLDEEG